MPSVINPRYSFAPALCAVSRVCLLHGEAARAAELATPASAQVHAFDIPAGPLDEVLLSIVRQGHTPKTLGDCP